MAKKQAKAPSPKVPIAGTMPAYQSFIPVKRGSSLIADWQKQNHVKPEYNVGDRDG